MCSWLTMMKDDLFQYFYSRTEGFVFSTEQEVIPTGISGNPHEREIKFLMAGVRRMAVKKSLQLPESFSVDCDRDDWIQLAMITMFQCCEKYDRKRPFDNYTRFMVSKKLADKHRSLLRKNPPADKEILYLYREMKKIQGNEDAITKLARDTNRSVEQLQELIDVGVGPRTFTSQISDASFPEPATKKPSPEAGLDKEEMEQILWRCINALSQKAKFLFIRYEMEEKDISLKNLFVEACCKRSLATFKRWYKREIFERVQQCVVSQV